MNPDEVQSYLSNIEEYVFDEKRIVSSTWLAITLGINVNIAKQLLSNFYNKNAKKEELSATFLLIGEAKSSNAVHVVVVEEKDLEDVEKKFKSITSKHVYSVQRCASIPDQNMLYLAGKTDVEIISKGISAIDFDPVKRESEEMDKLRLNSMPKVETKPNAFTKKTTNSNEQNKTKVPTAETKIQEPSKKCTDPEEGKESEAKVGDKKIPSMFSKTTAASKKKPVEKTNVAKKPQGIGAFFSKAPAKQNSEPTKLVSNDSAKSMSNNNSKEVSNTTEKSPSKENKAPLNITSVEEKPIEADVSTKQQPSTKTTKAPEAAKTKQKPKKAESKQAKSKKGAAKKKDNEVKQRKRLVVLSDSDSNESSDEEAREEALRREPSPEPEPEPVVVVPDEDSDDIISATPEPSVKKRKKKLVSRTFTSADGYMVTEKQLVDVSCSEDESEEKQPEKKFKGDKLEDSEKKTEEPSDKEKNITSANAKSPKENGSKPTEKKTKPKAKQQSPQKTKQASLMSFFKKK